MEWPPSLNQSEEERAQSKTAPNPLILPDTLTTSELQLMPFYSAGQMAVYPPSSLEFPDMVDGPVWGTGNPSSNLDVPTPSMTSIIHAPFAFSEQKYDISPVELALRAHPTSNSNMKTDTFIDTTQPHPRSRTSAHDSHRNNWTRPSLWDASRELVLVTGGSSGIGQQIMYDLAELNIRVIIFDIQGSPRPLPPNAHFYKTDLTSHTSISTSAAAVIKNHANPTILIHNAEIGTMGSILDEPEDLIRLTFDVIVLAHLWTVREFVPEMLEKNHYVVTVASMASFTNCGEIVAYSPSKAAVLALHKRVSQENKHYYGAGKRGED
ncbi:hypothetical protein BJX76DRAFT_362149 [Aspergillus varians]